MKKKIAFITTSSKISKKIENYLDKNSEFTVVDTSISNSLEVAKELILKGIKVIVTKMAIKLKIQEEVNIPIITMENTVAEYIDLLEEIKLENKKVAFIDYISPPESLRKMAKILSNKIYFKEFLNEENCKKMVEDCSKENIDIIVGGSLVKKYAMAFKIKTFDLSISEDTIEMYMDMARQVLEYTEKKSIKDEVLKNIEQMLSDYLEADIKLNNNVLDKVSMNDVERERLIEALKKNSFSISKTAKYLEMSRTTLWRKLKKFEIKIV